MATALEHWQEGPRLTIWTRDGMKIAAVVAVSVDNPTPLEASRVRMMATAPELFDALADTLRILEAVKLSAGLGAKQIERMERAKAALAKAGA